MARNRTWKEKLEDSKDLPRIEPIADSMSQRWGTGNYLIPAPKEVDALMRRVPKGKLTSVADIRASLARQHGTTISCPVTTGIFAWIAAHAADEAEREGRTRITPYWRTLKTRGELNPKYPGGIENLRVRLEAEGHTVVQRGSRYYVADFEESRFLFD